MPRVLVGELMDDPALDPAEHAHALRGLARLNALSGVTRQFYPRLKRLASRLDRPLTIVDIATGSADLPVALLQRARRDGVRLAITACDISKVALENASERARAAGVELATHQLDVLNEDPLQADVMTCALFLHHLTDDQVCTVLQKMAAAANEQVLVSDLRRGPWGTALAIVIPRLTTRSYVVHVDAVRSARAALSVGEARSMTRGISEGGSWRIDRAFPARMLIQWSTDATTTPS
ncbi:MAG: methyltransferase domain-containing protein [Phycisphaerales bacterium]|jgi:2-polyprenyl-3-methyl-5-hydroxy-6-metoxy-1,4-benzoquinol methylase